MWNTFSTQCNLFCLVASPNPEHDDASGYGSVCGRLRGGG